ncbi:hypothetical protein QJS10_CPA09g01120 [Acorus calamus]|uniref:ribose-5-phosphate isomerase n=1 Tax=Acorus calamus TaxID=4465 RepID=A0AAV9E4L7_ACOCL|nr:hypothetical protein QJS10_CPA09g01120 [Acorus calamus]
MLYGAGVRLLEAAKHTVIGSIVFAQVDSYVRNGMVVGLGTGRASAMAIEHLGRWLREGALREVVGVPTSVSSAIEAAKAGIPLDQYGDNLQLYFAFDDADVIEEGVLTAVIGRRKLEGGESIIQEKVNFYVDENQYSKDLDGSIPVLVLSYNWMETAEEIDDMFLGDAGVWRRPTMGHADPLGGDFPLVTREGHNVLDVIFTSPILNLAQVVHGLDQIDGVVDHGVIVDTP